MSAFKVYVVSGHNGSHGDLLNISLTTMLQLLLKNKLKLYTNEKLQERGMQNYPSENAGRGTNLDPSELYFQICNATFCKLL
jgi:hypothetical protein